MTQLQCQVRRCEATEGLRQCQIRDCQHMSCMRHRYDGRVVNVMSHSRGKVKEKESQASKERESLD
eukprot:2457370-Amphidinium_carterae.1